jgi:hypothetical protein
VTLIAVYGVPSTPVDVLVLWAVIGANDVAIADIRKHRGVPAQRGMRIYSRHSNRWGTIISSTSGYLKIRLDGDKHAMCYHPTWKLDYYDKSGSIIFRSPQD